MKTQEKNKKNILETEPVGKLIAKFAIPTIAAFLINTAYNITDQIFIGHVVGFLGNAATTVAFPMVNLILALSQLVGVGMAANFNISMGAKEEKEAKRFLGNGLCMLVVTAVTMFFFVFFFMDWILAVCGATAAVFVYAKEYMRITNIGMPFIIFVIASSNIIRADGSPNFSLISTLFGAILNVFLDWLFLFVFDMGIRGAAWATVIGQITSFLFVLYYYLHFKSFHIRLQMLELRFSYVIQIIKLGLANFINHVFGMIFNIVLNNVLRHYGALSPYGAEIPLAIAGIVAKVNSILFSISVGLAQAIQPILGYNIGAKNYKRVKETSRTALKIALVFGVVFFLIFQLMPTVIIGFFGKSDAVFMEFGARFLRTFMFMVVALAIQPLTINYFTAMGDVKSGLVLSIARQGLVMIPALVILPYFFGIEGALIAGPISDTISSAIALTMVFLSYKKMEKMMEM